MTVIVDMSQSGNAYVRRVVDRTLHRWSMKMVPDLLGFYE
jgi:hypothetical protein